MKSSGAQLPFFCKANPARASSAADAGSRVAPVLASSASCNCWVVRLDKSIFDWSPIFVVVRATLFAVIFQLLIFYGLLVQFELQRLLGEVGPLPTFNARADKLRRHSLVK